MRHQSHTPLCATNHTPLCATIDTSLRHHPHLSALSCSSIALLPTLLPTRVLMSAHRSPHESLMNPAPPRSVYVYASHLLVMFWQVTQFISATAAACSTVLLTSPLDLLKTRLQLHSGAEAPSFTSAAADLFRREGVIGFYRGSAPRLMHLTVWGGIIYQWKKVKN